MRGLRIPFITRKRNIVLYLALTLGIHATVPAQTVDQIATLETTTGATTTPTQMQGVMQATVTSQQLALGTEFSMGIPTLNPNGVYLVRLMYFRPSTREITKMALLSYGTECRFAGSTATGPVSRLVDTATGAVLQNLNLTVLAGALKVLIPDSALASDEQLLCIDIKGADAAPALTSPSDVTPWSVLSGKSLYRADTVGSFVLPVIEGAPFFDEATIFPSIIGQPQTTSTNYMIERPISPPTWGPPPGTWQPHPGKGEIPIDFGNGGGQDYQVPGGDIVPGGGGLHYGCVILDDTRLTFVVWKDLDGDGKIDRNEVIGITGQCEFPNADNELQITKDSNNQRHIRQRNINRGAPFYLNPPRVTVAKGGYIDYDYNVETGKLIVRIHNPNSSNDFVWIGDANDYPGWKGNI